MKKNFYITFVLCFLSLTVIKAQVGINTSSPDTSAVLDITSPNKGVLFPQYDLTILNSTTTPVANPADGLIIYNKGGLSTYPKGYYVWIRNSWERTILGGTEPQSMSLTVPYSNSTTPAVPFIPVNSTNNTVTNFIVAGNKITGASLAADRSTITLPAGTYIVRYSVDTIIGPSGSGPANTTYLSNILTCTRSYLVNAATNLPLTEQNRMCELSNVFTFWQGRFYLTLAVPTTIKQKFEFDTGNGLTNNELYIRASFGLNIIKMEE